jgi:hypothetical protein
MAPSEQCDSRCGMIRKPVHDTDGKQYGNSCGFAYQKCKNPKLEMYDCAKHNWSNKSTPYVMPKVTNIPMCATF